MDAVKISISEDPKITRKFIASFLDGPDGKPYLENPDGQPGIFIGDLSKPMHNGINHPVTSNSSLNQSYAKNLRKY